MQCPQCQHVNPAGTKFCGECATPLAALCESCGATNPPGHKFCGQCAAPLQKASIAKAAVAKAPAPHAYTPKHLADKILTSKVALEGERKQVTVLFCDIVESSRLNGEIAWLGAIENAIDEGRGAFVHLPDVASHEIACLVKTLRGRRPIRRFTSATS